MIRASEAYAPLIEAIERLGDIDWKMKLEHKRLERMNSSGTQANPHEHAKRRARIATIASTAGLPRRGRERPGTVDHVSYACV